MCFDLELDEVEITYEKKIYLDKLLIFNLSVTSSGADKSGMDPRGVVGQDFGARDTPMKFGQFSERQRRISKDVANDFKRCNTFVNYLQFNSNRKITYSNCSARIRIRLAI